MIKQKFLEKAHEKHGYKYKYIDLPEKVICTDYIKLEIDNIIYKQRISKHLEGKCPEKNTPKKTIEQFIEESKNIWGDRFDYSDTVYNGSLKKIKLYDKHNNIFIEQIASLHLQGHESKDITNYQFIEKSKLVSDYMYMYDKCNYINKTTKVILICEEHGDFEVKPFDHLNYGIVCKKCKFTIFGKYIKKFLYNNKISYYSQYKFDDFKLPFDFFIPSIRTCIEFYSDNNTLIKTNDKIKENYCEDNYINLIRIRYDQIDEIPKILKDNLSLVLKK